MTCATTALAWACKATVLAASQTSTPAAAPRAVLAQTYSVDLLPWRPPPTPRFVCPAPTPPRPPETTPCPLSPTLSLSVSLPAALFPIMLMAAPEPSTLPPWTTTTPLCRPYTSTLYTGPAAPPLVPSWTSGFQCLTP